MQPDLSRRGRTHPSFAPTSPTNGCSWALLAAITMTGGIFLLTNAHLLLPGWLFLALAGLSSLRLILRRQAVEYLSASFPRLTLYRLPRIGARWRQNVRYALGTGQTYRPQS